LFRVRVVVISSALIRLIGSRAWIVKLRLIYTRSLIPFVVLCTFTFFPHNPFSFPVNTTTFDMHFSKIAIVLVSFALAVAAAPAQKDISKRENIAVRDDEAAFGADEVAAFY